LGNYLPKVKGTESLSQIIKIDGEVILFGQNFERNIKDLKIKSDKKYIYFCAGNGKKQLNIASKD
jgi:hypothetical protein